MFASQAGDGFQVLDAQELFESDRRRDRERTERRLQQRRDELAKWLELSQLRSDIGEQLFFQLAFEASRVETRPRLGQRLLRQELNDGLFGGEVIEESAGRDACRRGNVARRGGFEATLPERLDRCVQEVGKDDGGCRVKRTSCRDFARIVRATRAIIAAPGPRLASSRA